MVAIPLDKINYNKVSKYANVLNFKEFYPKTKNVSYYLNIVQTDNKVNLLSSIKIIYLCLSVYIRLCDFVPYAT